MSILEKAYELEKSGIPFAVATILSSKGSSPRHGGSKMIVYGDNQIYGTIGGGTIEEEVKKQCLSCLRKRESGVFKYILNESSEQGLNMRCGGSIEVFIEVIAPGISIVMFGGGHIGLELSRLCDILNYPYTVVDNRIEYATWERFPNAKDVVYSEEFKDILSSVPIHSNSYIIIATHGHIHDEAVLQSVIDSGAAYIGMIGSKRKVQLTFDSLKRKGISEESLGKVFSPIGLDIGAETPSEIAVSIMAEIISKKNNTSGKHLKEVIK